MDRASSRRSDSRDPRLRSAGLHGAVHRLRAQVGLSWDKERDALLRLGLADDMAILDLGCGPGFFAERVLDLLPHARLTAVDLDPAMLAVVTAGLGHKHAGRVAVVEASVANTPL